MFLILCVSASAQSVFTTRPDDPSAIHLAAPEFPVRGDGTADDTAAIQAAIDKAGSSFSGGLVFIPSGRYRLTRTVYLWRAVRIVGYGATRPVFVLGDETPGFQQGMGVMLMFTGGGPVGQAGPAGAASGGRGRVPFPPPGSVPPNERIADANQNTFYPGITNVDFAIGRGNPAAVAIRFHVAQHGILSHMDFEVGSGLAALTQIGNEVQDLHIRGGRFGILTENTSPYWPFTVIDSVFEGQRDAAIREYMAGLTVVRTRSATCRWASRSRATYSDELWVKDSRFENVSGAAVIISNEKNAMTAGWLRQCDLHRRAGLRAIARERQDRRRPRRRLPRRQFQPRPRRSTRRLRRDRNALRRGAAGDAAGAAAGRRSGRFRRMTDWVNVRTLGVKGDGQTDDTDAIRKAIDTHRVLYFPTGYYVVRDTIALKPETTMIALHPGLTQLDLPGPHDRLPGRGAAQGACSSRRRAGATSSRVSASSPAASTRARPASCGWRVRSRCSTTSSSMDSPAAPCRRRCGRRSIRPAPAAVSSWRDDGAPSIRACG